MILIFYNLVILNCLTYIFNVLKTAIMKVTACEIFNHVDKKCYMLYVEWLNSHFKVMLLESTMLPLNGEMDIKAINYFSDELSKSSDDYLEETKKIFCGKDKEIHFFIENETLEWKRNYWILGKIKLNSVSNIQLVCKSFQQLLKLYESIQDKVNVLEEENKHLIEENKKLTSTVEKMIEVKTAMEQDLYNKFIIILNLKKKRIKELEDVIKEKQNVKESVFDACTDESEESEKETETVEHGSTIGNNIRKRKSIENNAKNVQKIRKANHTSEGPTPKPSTSKACANNKICISDDCKTTEKVGAYEEQDSSFKCRKSRSSLNFVEEESEEELFS